MTEMKNTDLIVLTVPHLGEPSAYRIDAESFCRNVEAAAGRRGQDAFYATTPRGALAESFAVENGAALEKIFSRFYIGESSIRSLDVTATLQEIGDEAGADAATLVDLGRNHGWDTPIYRADALLGEGVYTAEPIDRLDACTAYEARDLSALYVLKSEAEARDLVARLLGEDTPRIGQCGPQRAAWALERLLDARAA